MFAAVWLGAAMAMLSKTVEGRCAVKLSRVPELVSQYARAQLYAMSSIKKISDAHLLWGPLHARVKLGIGAKYFSLYSLASVPRMTWSDYLINEPLKLRYAAITSADSRNLADDKARFYTHCREHDISTVPILALITSLPASGTTIPHIYSSEDIAKTLGPGEYFLKPSNGSHGKGTFSLTIDGAGLQWSGRRGSYEDFFTECVSILKHTRALIVQPKLSNHQAIRDITHAKGLSTIRIVTFRQDDAIDVIAACLRIVVGASEVDNFSHGESGNLVGGIDVASGKLVTSIGSRSKTWPTMIDVPQHPQSNASILGISMPYWDEVIDLVKKAHATTTGLRTVGWDVAITQNGPLIVEANWRYDVDILQVAYKKGFRQIIDKYMA